MCLCIVRKMSMLSILLEIYRIQPNKQRLTFQNSVLPFENCRSRSAGVQ